jgi:hypothetical protein
MSNKQVKSSIDFTEYTSALFGLNFSQSVEVNEMVIFKLHVPVIYLES